MTNEPQRIVSFFPQMKPEKKAVELMEDEKVVINLLKVSSPIDLNELKIQAGLSNKNGTKPLKD
jgi:lysyl-tRNA synthetase class 2